MSDIKYQVVLTSTGDKLVFVFKSPNWFEKHVVRDGWKYKLIFVHLWLKDEE